MGFTVGRSGSVYFEGSDPPMTPGQAIQAGGLSVLRNQIRRINPDTDQAVLVIKRGGKLEEIHLNRPERREVCEALDLHLSDRLLKLGVIEYDEPDTLKEPERPQLDVRPRRRLTASPVPARMRKPPNTGSSGPASRS